MILIAAKILQANRTTANPGVRHVSFKHCFAKWPKCQVRSSLKLQSVRIKGFGPETLI